MSFKTSLTEGKTKTKKTLGGAVGASLFMGLMTAASADAIVPAGTAPVPQPPEAAPLTLPATTAANTMSPRLDLQFEDIEISKLLQIIAESFDVEIIVSDDVQGTLKSINLKGKTPKKAIEAVVFAGRLQYRITDEGTYIVAKQFPDNAPAGTQVGAPPVFGGQRPLTSDINPWNQPTDRTFDNLPPLNNSIGKANHSTIGLPGADPAAMASLQELDLPTLNKSAATEKRYQRAIRIRNVRAGIMAWWLDPANNALPREFDQSETNLARSKNRTPGRLAVPAEDMAAMNGNASTVVLPGFNSGFASNNPYVNRNSTSTSFNSSASMVENRTNFQFGGGGFGGGGGRGGGQGGRGGAAGGRGGGGTFQLPEGVDRVVAIDPQNSLLVFGTDEGVRQLQDIIGILDRPLRQVEIEAQFVTVTTSDTRSFGIDYSTARGNFNVNTTGFSADPAPGSLSVGFVRGNFQATLSALLSTNRAKVITAPRVLAINNLTASLQSTTSTPILLTSSTSNIGGNVGQAQNLIYITTAVGLTVTPTINNDDTVTVQMTPNVESQTDSGLSVGAPIISSNYVETIANVRDGDTIALGGLKVKNISRGGSRVPWVSDLPLIGKLFKSRRASDQDSELIIFLTARIIRRYGDDDAVVGAD